MRCLATLFFLSLTFTAHAETDQRWRWFLSSFCSPKLDSALCVRAGLAQVRIENGQVQATLVDPKIPEGPLIFNGNILKKNSVSGELQGLSSHAPTKDRYQGSYNALQTGKNCKAEQVVLLPEVPDGSVLSLGRVQGICQ